ncbi:Protein transport protein [Lachnellula occidentalis]|uniref:Protein transport protein n=1 Tax=Lachnellula occidentalis TaxID=215460 RepID=A0A8H8RRP2_9HELO|nr:Protein transport protein [Lachnellula occidentalis]
MPLLPGLIRRRGPSSDDIRRRSFLLPEAMGPPTVLDGRASEQIPRRPSAAEFMSPAGAEGEGASSTRASAEGATRPLEPSISPPVQQQSLKHHRFSMLKFRHASDSQLSTRARLQAQQDQPATPPMPHPYYTDKDIPAPEIITTAPTMDMNATRPKPTKKKSRILMGRVKSSLDSTAEEPAKVAKHEKKERRKTMSETAPSGNRSRVTFDELPRPSTQTAGSGSYPPAYGDDSNSALALPATRVSESSRSDGSSGDHGVYASTTTTTHTIHTTTTFFRMPRRKKTPAPLFDLSHLPQKSTNPDHAQSLAASRASASSSRISGIESAAIKALRSSSTEADVRANDSLPSPMLSPSPSLSHSALARTSSATGIAGLFRQGSTASSISSPTRARLGQRGRSSTLNSLHNNASDDALPTPTLPTSSRTSTSTGRKSFGDLFSMSHRRQNPEPPLPRNSGPATPGSSTSKNNSIQLAREPVVLPERFEDDTPAKYLVRLEEAVSRGVVASVLSKGTDPFSQAVLRSYMRGFGFFGDPMDMAIRKLLMEVELPKETQQIDRCLQGFANRYHECNPGIYASPDQAYFIAFSLLILHTDVFNKNNKHKMQKSEYLKNIRGEGIFDEILECFYDNISYTPFIHVEDDLDINGERIIQHKTKKKSILSRGNADPTKRPSKEPVDPYTLIIDSKLDTLRPNLKDVMYLEEHYGYLGTAPSLNLEDLQKTFFRTGVLQIVSARSRPDAFMSEKTVTNPEEAPKGIVDIKITKVGLLWRKDTKKKKTRSPWQEWGAILTGAQLYFFRNTAWIKNLMHQLETHIKQGHDGIPIIFKPPLEQFSPDALMSTDDAVALLDSTYQKHKNAFVFVRHGGFEETFLADNEQEMNDWLAKLNYAAAFRTAGVRMRGVVGGNYEGQRSRGIRRLGSQTEATRSVQTSTGEVTIVSGRIDTKMQQDILSARREIMQQKISEAEERLTSAEKQLDAQLRNARHLQILSPIQPKTREQVILAAGRMAAKLKWGRMEIWRLRCHRDILMKDLDEERNPPERAIPRADVITETAASERSTLDRLRSISSSAHRGQRPTSQATNRPPSSTLQAPQQDGDHVMDDIFQTAPILSSPSNFHQQQASWELPPLSFDALGRKASVSSAVPSSPSLAPTPSKASLKPTTAISDTPRAPSPNVDAAEQAVLEEAGLKEPEKPSNGMRPIAPDVESEDHTKDVAAEKEKLEKGKVRRSLHRTLREAHVPTHTRSKKGKDSSSSAGMSEEPATDDVLSRGTGSFVVHGKKASVIQFGSELQSMSPDERLRLRRQSHKEEPGNLSPATIEDDFQSTLAEPADFRERQNSVATTSSATTKSFRELHKRLYPSGVPAIVTSDGEDSEAAISFSEDGRRTPLPPVEDEEEDQNYLSRPGSSNQQAMFYTPEASNSPSRMFFSEKHYVGDHTDESNKPEEERLPTPPAQQTTLTA